MIKGVHVLRTGHDRGQAEQAEQDRQNKDHSNRKWGHGFLLSINASTYLYVAELISFLFNRTPVVADSFFTKCKQKAPLPSGSALFDFSVPTGQHVFNFRTPSQ
jgi:hypothetical protein